MPLGAGGVIMTTDCCKLEMDIVDGLGDLSSSANNFSTLLCLMSLFSLMRLYGCVNVSLYLFYAFTHRMYPGRQAVVVVMTSYCPAVVKDYNTV